VLKTQKDKFEESYNSSLVEIAELKRKCKEVEENYNLQMEELQEKLKTEYIQRENAIENEFDAEKQEIIIKYQKIIQQREVRIQKYKRKTNWLL